MMKLTVDGFPDLESAIRAVGKKAAREAALVAVQHASQPIVDEAKRLVPKDTGALAESLGFRTRPYRRGDKIISVIGANTQATGPDGRKPAKYAHLVELGHEGYPAHPFLRPALEAKKNSVMSQLADTFGVALKIKADKLAEVRKARSKSKSKSR